MREITLGEFESGVLLGRGITVVDFFKDDCQPCVVAARLLEEMEANYPTVRFVKLNVAAAPDFVSTMGIQYAPTVVIFENGEPIDFVARAIREPTLRRKLDARLP